MWFMWPAGFRHSNRRELLALRQPAIHQPLTPHTILCGEMQGKMLGWEGIPMHTHKPVHTSRSKGRLTSKPASSLNVF